MSHLVLIVWRGIIIVVVADRCARATRDAGHVGHLAARNRRIHVIIVLADELAIVTVHRHCILLLIIHNIVLLAIGKSTSTFKRR